MISMLRHSHGDVCLQVSGAVECGSTRGTRSVARASSTPGLAVSRPAAGESATTPSTTRVAARRLSVAAAAGYARARSATIRLVSAAWKDTRCHARRSGPPAVSRRSGSDVAAQAGRAAPEVIAYSAYPASGRPAAASGTSARRLGAAATSRSAPWCCPGAAMTLA